MNTHSPIFVTGMPRSGTTLFQHFLSCHPLITIHGQEPLNLIWGEWLDTVVRGAAFATESNAALDYAEPHYAGAVDPDRAATLFLEFVRGALCADRDSSRWGVKSLTQCRVCPEPILRVWPDTRWIVCVRHPFRSIESLRNTFDPEGVNSLDVLCGWWSDAVAFALARPQAKLVLVDRLQTPESRRRMTAEVFAFLGEEPTSEVWRFVDDWPVIHKAVSDEQRKFALSEHQRSALMASNPQFAALIDSLGYLSHNNATTIEQ